MKKNVSYLVVMSGLVLGASFAHAGGTSSAPSGKMHGGMHERMHAEMYKSMDTNADGAISREEFDAFHARKFQELDVNGDGKITPDEKKMHKKMGAGAFSRKTEADATSKKMDATPGKFDYYKTNRL